MESFKDGDLTIDAARQGPDVIRLDWRGKSNSRHPAAVLGPYFERLIRCALDESRGIEMHFEAIEHFNSSTITALIQLIQKLGANNLRMALVYDPTLKWQKLSFDALKVFENSGGPLSILSAGAN